MKSLSKPALSKPASRRALVVSSSLLTSVACAGFATSSHAADYSRFREPKPRVVEDLFRVEVSVVGATFDTTVRIDDDNSTVRNTDINLEDDLGLDDMRSLIQAEI